ncbi:MAG: hypothetical protein HC896_05885 [Bacteroidales bacterium]|nr:hypothetical protein [Bacteroidales bacterium]
MATLQKIRNRAGLLISIVIGLALIAFILGDALSSNSSLFTGNQFEVAKIKGKSVHIKEFNQRVEELATIYKMNGNRSNLDDATMQSIRNQVWNEMVEETVLGEELKKLGLGVSADEVFDIIQGDDPHPIVRQLFTDPNTGQLNKAALINFWKSLGEDETGERLVMARFIENSILKERKSTKYLNLVKKGLGVSNIEAEMEYFARSRKVDFHYVSKSFTSVPDSTIKITDADIKDYYNKHKYKYTIKSPQETYSMLF